MIFNELFEDARTPYQDLSQDNSQPRLGDLRKTKLTLRQINKLRRMQDVRAFEFREKIKRVQQQYAPPAQPVI
jgi:hypothetical protein